MPDISSAPDSGRAGVGDTDAGGVTVGDDDRGAGVGDDGKGADAGGEHR
jgi:hypothetical protein